MVYAPDIVPGFLQPLRPTGGIHLQRRREKYVWTYAVKIQSELSNSLFYMNLQTFPQKSCLDLEKFFSLESRSDNESTKQKYFSGYILTKRTTTSDYRPN